MSRKYPEDLRGNGRVSGSFIVAGTTRSPRPGEADGIDYRFVSVEDFIALDRRGDLLESGIYEGNNKLLFLLLFQQME